MKTTHKVKTIGNSMYILIPPLMKQYLELEPDSTIEMEDVYDAEDAEAKKIQFWKSKSKSKTEE